MIIDKVAPFFTNEDNASLNGIDRRKEQLLENSRNLVERIKQAREIEDIKQIQEITSTQTNLWFSEYQKLSNEENEILHNVEQRYIESFKGNTSDILKDVKEIVDAIEKKDYLEHQNHLTAYSKDLISEKPNKDSSKVDKEFYKLQKRLSTRGYENCYWFILARIRVQLNAFEYYEDKESGSKAIKLVEAKAESFYKKPKALNPAHKTQEHNFPAPIQEGIHGAILTSPTSPFTALISDVLSIDNLEQLKARKQSYNRNIRLKIENDDGIQTVSYNKGETEITVEVVDIRNAASRNAQTMKLFKRILIEAIKQAIHNGELIRDKVEFPLQDLVDSTEYKNLDTARKGFYNATRTLTGIKVSGKIQQGKKKTIRQGTHVVLFKGAEVDRSTCVVYLNELIDWRVITAYFTGIPDYYFELPDRASILLDYIFYLARQNTKQIATQGYFTISYRAIYSKLNLPDELATKNPKRDIKDAIENAIEQIEDANNKYAPPINERMVGYKPDFSLLPCSDPGAPITKYLNEGYLKVFLKGDYAKRFIELNRKSTEKIESNIKKLERIEEHARAINMAKTIEKRNQTSGKS